MGGGGDRPPQQPLQVPGNPTSQPNPPEPPATTLPNHLHSQENIEKRESVVRRLSREINQESVVSLRCSSSCSCSSCFSSCFSSCSLSCTLSCSHPAPLPAPPPAPAPSTCTLQSSPTPSPVITSTLALTELSRRVQRESWWARRGRRRWAGRCLQCTREITTSTVAKRRGRRRSGRLLR